MTSETASRDRIPREVAEELQVSINTVLQWIRQGSLSAYNVGSPGKRPSWRITQAACDDFKSKRSNQTDLDLPADSAEEIHVKQFV